MDVTDRQPHELVHLNPPVEVLFEVDGQHHHGYALAYAGDRVTVRYSRGPGMNHLAVVDAAAVTRVA